MTSIKPPSSGPTGPQSLPDTPDLAGAQKSEGTTSSSFQQALESAQAHQVASTTQVSGTGLDPIAALSQDIEAGRVTLDQAVERLVQQTLTKAEKHLTGEQVNELSGLLRDALLSDPTLRGLRGEHS